MNQLKFKDPLHKKGVIETMADDLADGLISLGKFLFGQKEKEPEVHEEPSIPYWVEEKLSLYKEKISPLLQKTAYRTKEEVYSALCINMPEPLVNEMVSTLKLYISAYNPYSSSSYEEIMKTFMNYSVDINNIPWFITQFINVGSKLIDYCIGFLNKFTSSNHDTLDIKVLSLRPYVLALIWAILMVEIVRKYTGSCGDYDLRNIAKLSISVVLSLFAGFTGFMHAGGSVGVTSPTKYLRTYYNAQKFIEERYPYQYYNIPDFLKFRNDSFDSLTNSMQISAGKGLSMAYTFRIGDALIENLLNHKVVSEDVIERTFKSIWPVPSTYESQKMYKLYTESRIYYI